LRGVLPSFNLPYLEDLYLNDNFLEGSIPNLKMPNLKILNIADNLLVGSIPNFDCPIITNIQLGNNKLTGTIPKFNFPLIDQLNLANNKLFGCIPKKIKKNCPLLGSIGGDILNNANLSTIRWIDYWEKGEGTCPPCDSIKTSIEGLNTICKGSITNFVVKSGALLPTYLWSSGESNSSIQINKAGLYTVTVTQADGCSKTASISLTVNDSIVVQQDTSILVSDDFKLPTGFSAASTGSYRSVLKQKNGCDSIIYTRLTVCTEKGKIDSILEKITIRQSDSATLKNGKRIAPMFDTLVIDTIRLPCSIRYDKTYITVKPRNFIKTAITPNNDGINDKLDIPIIDWQRYPLSRIEIFNRWSQQVYASEPYQKDWAGQSNDGKELPEGDYFFVLSLKPNGDVLKGMVHIFR
jgi:gliding motility-associated-like protein